MHWLTLRFSHPDLERQFRHAYFTSSLTAARIGLVLGLVLYATFGVLDEYMVSEIRGVVWAIRFGVVCPLIVLNLALSLSSVYERFWQAGLAILGLAGIVGVVMMATLAQDPANHLYGLGVMLPTIFVYVLLRLRFVIATAVGVTGLILYPVLVLTAAATPSPAAILVNNLFFLVAINVVGATAAYLLERFNRRTWLQEQVIKRQAEDLQKALHATESERRQAVDRSNRDPLTGLFNRGFFFERGEQCLGGARGAGPASFLMVDVDHFKDVNDSCGHDVGDDVLRALAAVLAESMRPDDVLCRYGGEEFAAILFDADLEQGVQAAERIRVTVEQRPVSTQRGLVGVTVSVGVAAVDSAGDVSLGEQVRNADLAMYEAKSAGGDRVRSRGPAR